MAEYLLPSYEKISIFEQRYIFAIRNRMVQIETNFPTKFSKNLCFCGNEANQEHIYTCHYLNKEKETIEFKRIYEENVNIQKQIYKRFEKCLETRKQKQNEENTPLDPSGRSAVITNPVVTVVDK